ncbi:hypothetical protein GO491_09710 [Flavobacteriaceae bacterium Ap0902]|nr:hypothetical protein [Flavobacteriaceae bacterium Ap0902]
MSAVIKILLFAIILYFILSWIRSLIRPTRPKSDMQSNVRIFKQGDVEKSSMQIRDAETVEYEEIENKE